MTITCLILVLYLFVHIASLIHMAQPRIGFVGEESFGRVEGFRCDNALGYSRRRAADASLDWWRFLGFRAPTGVLRCLASLTRDVSDLFRWTVSGGQATATRIVL